MRYFRFYDDGTCEPGCPNPDPDCARGAPVSDRLEFLCGPPVGQPDGLCLKGCPGEDPDCSAQATRSREGDYSDRDGYAIRCVFQTMKTVSRREISVSPSIGMATALAMNCAFPDPDCSNTPLPADALEDWERDFCSRTVQRVSPTLRKSQLRASARSNTISIPTCVASCLNADN